MRLSTLKKAVNGQYTIKRDKTYKNCKESSTVKCTKRNLLEVAMKPFKSCNAWKQGQMPPSSVSRADRIGPSSVVRERTVT